MEGEVARTDAAYKVVLLIDDDEDDYDIFTNALKEIAPSHKAVLLTKVDHIIQYFEALDEKDVPCLVVTDLNLPPTDGFEVIEKLKSDPRYLHIPVIVYSNSANPRDILKAKESGATAYVHKAASLSEVIEDVREMIRYCLI
jgi:CheY-like chemotaxis protein